VCGCVQLQTLELLLACTGLGLPSCLDFFSSKPVDVAGVLNCVHALLTQRSADRDTLAQLEASHKQLRFDLQVPCHMCTLLKLSKSDHLRSFLAATVCC
jgi:SUMO ligase MMS21 Smc5/6 complex component